MELTEKKFWEDFWRNLKLPQTINPTFKNDRVIANVIARFIPKRNFDRIVVEIGCAPGKWLVYFNKELGYRVEGYEYIPLAAQKTIENLKVNNVPESQFHIHVGDFQKEVIQVKYDVVLSLGFVEHFQNFEEIMQKQLFILKKHGYLIVGMPNFRGVNFLIQWVIDYYLENKILPTHNLKIMKKQILQNLSTRYNLKPIFINYIGGFERSFFSNEKITNRILRFGIDQVIKIGSALFEKIDNPVTSGYLLAIFQKLDP